MTNMLLILQHIKAPKIILHHLMDFTTNTTNGRRQFTKVRRHIIMEKNQKDQELILVRTLYIYHQQEKHQSILSLRMTEGYFHTRRNNSQDPATMKLIHKQLRQRLRTQHLQCQELQGISVSQNIPRNIMYWQQKVFIE